MVLFSNINVNQRVELLHKNQVLNATVKYKGAVHTLDGDWVGLALDQPVGAHNGLYKGRRYFECKGNHGVFVRAGSVRFTRNTTRRMFNKYYKHYDTGIDEELFGSSITPQVTDGPNYPIFIDGNKYKQGGNKNSDLFDWPRRFALSGSVSRQIPAATMKRPMSAAAVYTYTSEPVHFKSHREVADWEPVPSIPKTHMPHSAQISQTKRGWNNAPWTRELSYPKARHSMKSTRWNDVSF